MKKTVETDIVIVGGGIAGLWLLNRLRTLGFSTILLESNTLGGEQTLKSQGIIHGGMKYALQGAITAASQAIADMPALWMKCLSGKGEIDLSAVPVLSHEQFLWSNNKLIGKLAGFFANQTLAGEIDKIPLEAYPEIFKNPAFKGQIYALKEIVIDVPTLIRELVKPNQDAVFRINPIIDDHLHIDETDKLTSLSVMSPFGDTVEIKANKYIFTAGAGNELLIKKLNTKEIAMQRRPLHMVLMKTDFPYTLYAHCLGLGATPRITITTHQTHDGKTAWYLGGQIAEEGVKRDSATQCKQAKKELSGLFPWLDFSKAQFTSFFIDRAEPQQPDGKRPDSVYIKNIQNMMIAWPTKLALAPKLTQHIIDSLAQENITPGDVDIRELRAWPMPSLAVPIWDELL